MSLISITILLIGNWVAGFVLQPHQINTEKSKKLGVLINQGFIYSFILSMHASLLFSVLPPNELIYKTIMYFIINFFSHTFVDYFTSRYNKKLWTENKIHDFFVAIGFEQLLYTLFILYSYTLVFNYL